ncbi:hypothetical protein [Synechococcus sp. C9]|uniref:hypothetical protein n=1 Tax=Synechococcus sp. C9 TaxID=102119 RepID=UPI001FF64969|nr:hypothetical protein [Synechococcus sp. C9]
MMAHWRTLIGMTLAVNIVGTSVRAEVMEVPAVDWVRQSEAALIQGDQVRSLEFLEQAIRGMSGGQILDLLLQGQRWLRQGRTEDVLALLRVVMPLLQGLMTQIPAESLPADAQVIPTVVEPLIKNLPNFPETRPIMDMMQTLFKQLGR